MLYHVYGIVEEGWWFRGRASSGGGLGAGALVGDGLGGGPVVVMVWEEGQ